MHRTRAALHSFLVLAGTALPAAADVVVINFDFYPGPDLRLGTPDDVPIVAPTGFAQQTLQLTDQFAAAGIVFAAPPVQDKNEILNNNSFTNPPGSTEPNLLASGGVLSIEASFTVPVFQVGALIGISGGSDRLEIFDSGGASLGAVVGDDVFVSLSSPTPIARFVITPFTGTGPAIDNLTYTRGTTCYADCDGIGGLTGNDFQCFLNAFVSAASYADCDGVGGLTGNDFQCFLDKYVAGCQ